MACSDVTLSRQSKNGMHSPTGHDYSGIDDDIRSNIRTNCMIINESLTFVCGSGSTFLISVSKSICPSALYWSAEAAINRITLNTKVGRRMAIISRKADETELYELETSDLNSNIVTGYRETGSMTRNCAANTILYELLTTNYVQFAIARRTIIRKNSAAAPQQSSRTVEVQLCAHLFLTSLVQVSTVV